MNKEAYLAGYMDKEAIGPIVATALNIGLPLLLNAITGYFGNKAQLRMAGAPKGQGHMASAGFLGFKPSVMTPTGIKGRVTGARAWGMRGLGALNAAANIAPWMMNWSGMLPGQRQLANQAMPQQQMPQQQPPRLSTNRTANYFNSPQQWANAYKGYTSRGNVNPAAFKTELSKLNARWNAGQMKGWTPKHYAAAQKLLSSHLT